MTPDPIIAQARNTEFGRPCGQPALAAAPSSPVPGLAPPGFDQAYRSRTIANIIASFEAADERAGRALADAADILREIREAEQPLRNQIPMGGKL